MKRKQRFTSLAGLAATLLIAVGFFTLIFYYDNKYTLRAPISQDGQTIISKNRTFDPVYLVEGWELYPDELLLPTQLAQGIHTPMRTFVGEYLNMAGLNGDRSPYGVATWRLQIRYDGSPVNCTLLLPEVFSAFTLYVDGELTASRGSLQPYYPHIQDTVVSFLLRPQTELVIHTANYTHYYSGVTYPPVLGSAQAIQLLTGARLLFYGLLCFGALATAFFSAAVWLGIKKGRDPIALLFGTLALSFAVWVSYPFSRFMGAPFIRPLYALEDAALLLVLWCALRITLRLCKQHIKRWGKLFSRFALAMLLVGVVVPLFVIPAAPAFATLYGKLMTLYRLYTALLLVGLALWGSLRGQVGAGWLLYGTGFLATGLLASACTVSSFEPARFGWMEEYAALAMVLCFGVLMVLRSYELVWENRRLTEHLKEEIENKSHDLDLLMHEREGLISKFLHDMKSPASFMLSYVHMVREHNVGLDDQTRKALAIIEEKCGVLSDSVRMAQQFTIENPLVTRLKTVDLCTLLREFYRFNQPDVEMDMQNFLLEVPDTPCYVSADENKIGRMLQNLVYNAVSYTPPEGEILLKLTYDHENAYITVRDNGCDIAPEIIPNIFNRFFTTRAEEGSTGMGLYIVRTIAREHGGEVSVSSRHGEGASFTIWLPLTQPE